MGRPTEWCWWTHAAHKVRRSSSIVNAWLCSSSRWSIGSQEGAQWVAEYKKQLQCLKPVREWTWLTGVIMPALNRDNFIINKCTLDVWKWKENLKVIVNVRKMKS